MNDVDFLLLAHFQASAEKPVLFFFTLMNQIIIFLPSETYWFRYAERFFSILHTMSELQISSDYTTVTGLLNCSTAVQI